MAVRESEKRLPDGLKAGDLGQATEHAGASGAVEYALVSYLTSPIAELTGLDYVVFALNGAAADRYEWRVLTESDTSFHHTTTEIGIFRWDSPRLPGIYKVRVAVWVGEEVRAELELQQEVVPRDATLEAHLAKYVGEVVGSPYDAMRELVNDLKPYLVAAVAETNDPGVPNAPSYTAGAKPKDHLEGIPLRLLASVLYMEIRGRPKDGTSAAKNVRTMLGEQTTWSWWPRLSAANPFADPMAKHFDDIRDVEIELVAEFLDEVNPVARAFMAGKSLGVGQLGQATAAMTLGLIPWRDAYRFNRALVRSDVAADYSDLTLEQKVDVFNRLRFPKTNVRLAAMHLAMLKNRLHRWPAMTPADLAKDHHACAILATEYHIGPSATDRKDAKEDGNGFRLRTKYIPDGSFLAPEVFFQ